MSKQLVVGRVVQQDGVQTIVPVSHRQETLNYQKIVQDLVQAAREYRDNPNEETLTRLAVLAQRVK